MRARELIFSRIRKEQVKVQSAYCIIEIVNVIFGIFMACTFLHRLLREAALCQYTYMKRSVSAQHLS